MAFQIFFLYAFSSLLAHTSAFYAANTFFYPKGDVAFIVHKNGVFVASVCQHKKGSGMVKDCCIKNFNAFRLQQASSSATDKNEDEKKIEANEEKLGNLVADDEWLGLTMELTELVRLAIVEDVKKQTRDFIGKDNYKVSTPRYIIYVLVVQKNQGRIRLTFLEFLFLLRGQLNKIGDIAKEIDKRVKEEIALFRNKDEYELGDLSIALDKISKDLTCQLTGKDEYEFGDLSREIDSRVKAAVCKFCNKGEGETYQVGDLSREVDRRVKSTIADFTSKGTYEFGDVSREINRRRELWVKEYLGKDDYQFGDITKKAITEFTGKENYEFGDISRKLLDNVFGKRKKGGGEPK